MEMGVHTSHGMIIEMETMIFLFNMLLKQEMLSITKTGKVYVISVELKLIPNYVVMGKADLSSFGKTSETVLILKYICFTFKMKRKEMDGLGYFF
jgi:hypothetical protein